MPNTKIYGLIVCAAILMLSRPAASGQTSDYNQPYRPQVHFSPLKHWTNDPNGLVYFRGEYHLFFQYNPFGDEWGHMSWGHAVSTDLLHWHQLPVAIPEKGEEMVFTGSVVVDRKNSSGFCSTGRLKRVINGVSVAQKTLGESRELWVWNLIPGIGTIMRLVDVDVCLQVGTPIANVTNRQCRFPRAERARP